MTNEASSDVRERIARAISSGRAMRRIGSAASGSARVATGSSLAAKYS